MSAVLTGQHTHSKPSNSQTRGIPLPGATFDSPAAQASRFLAAGFDKAGAKSLKDIRKDVLPRTELERQVPKTRSFFDSCEQKSHHKLTWVHRQQDRIPGAA
jgi:hypothetical protein